MATLSLTKAKKSDSWLKHLLFCYTRSVQTENEAGAIVPDEVVYLCILFSSAADYWDVIGNNTYLSRSRMEISKLVFHGWRNSSYGKQVIKSTSKRIVMWKLKMGKSTRKTYIGIASNTNCQDRLNTDKYCRNGTKNSFYVYKSRRLLTLTLNLKERKIKLDGLKCSVSSTIKIDNNVSYRLAVSLRNPDDSITIVDFFEYC